MVEFNFDKYTSKDNEENKIVVEKIKTSSSLNPAINDEEKKKKINFQNVPEDINQTLSTQTQKQMIDKYTKEEPVAIPYETSSNNSYLNLVLSPNFRELELMIRGLEYVKRYNALMGKEEIILRKIPDHPLNEYGINKILQEIKVYASPEIKLGRKRVRDYYNSVQQVSKTITRLVYKNLKKFGMDTQDKQRNAKTFCLAIIEIVDASFSRSIEGKENDLSRATEFKIEGNIDTINDPAKLFNKPQKEALKN